MNTTEIHKLADDIIESLNDHPTIEDILSAVNFFYEEGVYDEQRTGQVLFDEKYKERIVNRVTFKIFQE